MLSLCPFLHASSWIGEMALSAAVSGFGLAVEGAALCTMGACFFMLFTCSNTRGVFLGVLDAEESGTRGGMGA